MFCRLKLALWVRYNSFHLVHWWLFTFWFFHSYSPSTNMLEDKPEWHTTPTEKEVPSTNFREQTKWKLNLMYLCLKMIGLKDWLHAFKQLQNHQGKKSVSDSSLRIQELWQDPSLDATNRSIRFVCSIIYTGFYDTIYIIEWHKLEGTRHNIHKKSET